MSRGIANDYAIRGIGGVARDSCDCERFGIGPIGVTVVTFEENGAVGKKFIEIFFVGQRFCAEHGVIPAPAQNPVIARMFCDVIAQALLNFGNVFCAGKIHAAQAEGAVDEVDVAIDETGEDELTGGVNNFCAGTAKFSDGGVVANGNDFVAANGNSLRPGLFSVESVNAAVNNDGVSLIFYVLRDESGGGAEKNRNQEHDAMSGLSQQFSVLLKLKCRGRIDPQHPSFGPAGIFPAMRRGTFKIEAVAGIEAIVLAVLQPNFEIAA